MWITHHRQYIPWGSRETWRPEKNLWDQPTNLWCERERINLLTKNGWSISANMVFSEITWSTCLSFMISAFFKRFIAKNSPDFLFLASITLPNEPIINNYVSWSQERENNMYVAQFANHLVIFYNKNNSLPVPKVVVN